MADFRMAPTGCGRLQAEGYFIVLFVPGGRYPETTRSIWDGRTMARLPSRGVPTVLDPKSENGGDHNGRYFCRYWAN